MRGPDGTPVRAPKALVLILEFLCKVMLSDSHTFNKRKSSVGIFVQPSWFVHIDCIVLNQREEKKKPKRFEKNLQNGYHVPHVYLRIAVRDPDETPVRAPKALVLILEFLL